MSNKKTNKHYLKEFVRLFSPYVKGILLEGSCAWAGFQFGQDMDLEFIVPNFKFLKKLAESCRDSNKRIAETIDSFSCNMLRHCISLDIKMVSLKLFLQKQEISLRFTKSTFFSKICNFNFQLQEETKSILQYRTSPTKPYCIQRNFNGGKIKYERLSFVSKRQQLIETPMFIIDTKGRFYPGSTVDRYLSFPQILYEEESFCKKNIKKLKFNLVKRLISEYDKGLHTKTMSLDLCLARRDKISLELLSKLKNEGDRIKLNIEKMISNHERKK